MDVEKKLTLPTESQAPSEEPSARFGGAATTLNADLPKLNFPEKNSS